jgi:hypothetical protein
LINQMRKDPGVFGNTDTSIFHGWSDRVCDPYQLLIRGIEPLKVTFAGCQFFPWFEV